MPGPGQRSRTARLEALTEAVIAAVKDLAGRGEKVSPQAVARLLAERPEAAWLDQAALPRPEPVSDPVASRADLDRLREQKEELFRQLRRVEEEAGLKDDFYRRALLVLLRLAEDEDEAAVKAVEAFRASLAAGAGLEDLEEALRTVKNHLLQAAPAQDKPAPGALARLFKGGRKDDRAPLAAAALTRIKATYLDFLAAFDLDLEPDYQARLKKLRHKIASGDDLDYLLGLHPELSDLAQSYARLVFRERDQAAAFVAEVGRRLAEMEGRLLASLGHAQALGQSNQEFTQGMTDQIDQVSGSVRLSRDLEELRGLVLSKLASFRESFERKRQEDEKRLGEANQELTALQDQVAAAAGEIARVRQENEILKRKVDLDPLTGIANRRALGERLAEEWERFTRYQRPFSLIMLDLDFFKRINDTYGHPVGDLCLKEVANLSLPQLRKTDLLARYGGEEFLVVLPETTRPQAKEAAEKLRANIDRTEFILGPHSLRLTISLGVAEVKDSDRDFEAVLKRVDRALYQAKSGGRNRVEAG